MKAKMICCVCGKFLYWTDTSDGRDSHAYCPKHFAIEMQKLDEWLRNREALHQQEEPAAEGDSQ